MQRGPDRFHIFALLTILLTVGLHAQTGVFFDQGGAVFNVKAYGAAGTGGNDTAAIQSAINAAINAGGGIVYFPAGQYRLDATLQNNRMDLVSMVGSGVGTELIVNNSLGISLGSTQPYVGTHGFHSGRIDSMKLSCTSMSYTAVQMNDMVAMPQLLNLSVKQCNKGFEVINTAYWSERLVAINLSDFQNNHLFHFNQNPSNGANSYGYGIYDGIFINKLNGQDVFYLTGGAYLYHSTFVIKGNFDQTGSAYIFNVQGTAGQPCPGAASNNYDIAVEGPSGSNAVVNAVNNGCSGGATGNTMVSGSGIVSADNVAAGVGNLISDRHKTPFLLTTFTASGSTSDNVTGINASPGSSCFVQPANATAASVNGTYVSSVGWGSVTVSHSSSAAGGLYQIWCIPTS